MEAEANAGPYSNVSETLLCIFWRIYDFSYRFQQLTIFNSRQKLSKPTQSSSLIYNGFGGSERKENFVGFPNIQSRINAAGRAGLPSLGSSKSGINKK